MQIRFNGTTIFLAEKQTLMRFLEKNHINANTPGLAIALNEQIISRSIWSDTILQHEDRLEVVHAVQGG